MIKVGVISDTHGNFYFAAKAINVLGQIDYLLHAGDGKNEALALGKLANCPVWAVAGNTDGVTFPQTEVMEIGGIKILLLHGYQVAPLNREERLADLALEQKAEIVVYGHTHKPYCNYHRGVLVFNPGSPFRPRDSKPSCGLIEIEAKNITAKHLKIP